MLVKFGLSTVITKCDSNVPISEAESKTIIFITGYAGHQLINKVAKCDICARPKCCSFVMHQRIREYMAEVYKALKPHNAYACERYEVCGTYTNRRMVYTSVNDKLRTDKDSSGH